MKMQNEELLQLKIKIDCNNLVAYREICLLVDNPDFLSEVKTIRKELDIAGTLPMKYKNWYFDSESWARENFSKNTRLVKASKRLAKKYNKPTFFDLVVYQAILFGRIIAEEPRVDILSPLLKPDKPSVVIYPTPHTTNKEIAAALKKAKKLFKLKPKYFSEHTAFPNFRVKKKNSLHHEIKKHRAWFWKNIAKESYTKIALSLVSNKERKKFDEGKINRYQLSTYFQVKQALTRYKKQLKNLK